MKRDGSPVARTMHCRSSAKKPRLCTCSPIISSNGSIDYLGSTGCQPAVVGSLPTTLAHRNTKDEALYREDFSASRRKEQASGLCSPERKRASVGEREVRIDFLGHARLKPMLQPQRSGKRDHGSVIRAKPRLGALELESIALARLLQLTS